jgi:ankyrin repeat protein
MSELLEALYMGQDERVAELLADDRELDVFEAAAVGNVPRLRVLLEEGPSLTNAFGDDGFHPLGLACFFGHVDAARLLLEHGADPNMLSRNEHIQTASLHAACAAQGVDEGVRYELVRLALEHGADPNLPQGGGFRAIDAARQNGDLRVEELLLEYGAKPSGWGQTQGSDP